MTSWRQRPGYQPSWYWPTSLVNIQVLAFKTSIYVTCIWHHTCSSIRDTSDVIPRDIWKAMLLRLQCFRQRRIIKVTTLRCTSATGIGSWILWKYCIFREMWTPRYRRINPGPLFTKWCWCTDIRIHIIQPRRFDDHLSFMMALFVTIRRYILNEKRHCGCI